MGIMPDSDVIVARRGCDQATILTADSGDELA